MCIPLLTGYLFRDAEYGAGFSSKIRLCAASNSRTKPLFAMLSAVLNLGYVHVFLSSPVYVISECGSRICVLFVMYLLVSLSEAFTQLKHTTEEQYAQTLQGRKEREKRTEGERLHCER